MYFLIYIDIWTYVYANGMPLAYVYVCQWYTYMYTMVYHWYAYMYDNDILLVYVYAYHRHTYMYISFAYSHKSSDTYVLIKIVETRDFSWNSKLFVSEKLKKSWRNILINIEYIDWKMILILICI